MTHDPTAALRAAVEALVTCRDYISDASLGALAYRGRADISEMAGGDLVFIDETIAAARAALDQPVGAGEHGVVHATVRMAIDEEGNEELHIECRMADGQKGAFVRVDPECEVLAHWIAAALSHPPAAPDAEEIRAAAKTAFYTLNKASLIDAERVSDARSVLARALFRTAKET